MDIWIWCTIYLAIGIVISISLFGFPPNGKMSELAPWVAIGYPIFIILVLYAWVINNPRHKHVEQVPLKPVRIIRK